LEIVLGASMAPATIRMVLTEGENADGVTVDQDNFDLGLGNRQSTLSGPDQLIAAILGTRQGATEAGYQLSSIGVTWTDHRDAAALATALAARKIDNLMLFRRFWPPPRWPKPSAMQWITSTSRCCSSNRAPRRWLS
jgi:hypothetical protein